MASMVKANADEVVKAFRKAAKEMGCDQSEQRFQDVLFSIGRDKPLRRASKSPKVSRKAKRSR
jgi:hypothetical protein